MVRTLSSALALVLAVAPSLGAQEKVDLETVHKIRQEAFERSKVMEHIFYLTDVSGPRLTGTPEYLNAANWAVKRLADMGVTEAKLEKWGPFGRGWSYSKFSAHMVEPNYMPLIGFPLAWCEPTNGPVKGDVVQATIRLEPDFEKYKGKLRGKIVFVDAKKDLSPQDKPSMQRWTDAELIERAMDPAALPAAARNQTPSGPMPGIAPGQPFDMAKVREFVNKRNQFFKDEGVLAVVTMGTRNDGGTMFATSGGNNDPKRTTPPPMMVIAAEQYNRVVRLTEAGIPVKLEVDLAAKFHNGEDYTYNVIGEIPGTAKRDEVVMIGAHLDSWHGATGATDNAAGSAIMLEVMRILKALDLKMDRTVRIGLWSGEEQGLLGSRAYVKEHFADPEKMDLKTEHAKLAGYYNIDNGTGKIRGIYLQGNTMLRPVFEALLAPFKDLGATTVSIRTTGGTDHLAFDAVGLPGFQFIQDPIEYQTRTHHSNMDVYDRIVPEDMKQMSAIVASFVYHTATREEKLARKPLPKPGERRAPDGRPAPAKPSAD
ncbi:MAG: M20/M25/M40 family metallo-hydrolase [Bryobacteraceae bacterium]|nr:M20/M25/M40 family metallo-hydrolase [Bryobacteraceae bacterium]